MLVLLATIGWACPTPDAVDATPCDAWGGIRATPLNGFSGAMPLSEGAPLLFYVHPSVQDVWEDSLMVTASLDGTSFNPGVALDVDAPIAQLWVDVPVGAELEVAFDWITRSETVSTTIPVSIESTSSEEDDVAFDFSALTSAVNLCGFHTWVASDPWADRPVLVQPVGAGGVPTRHNGSDDLVLEMAADSSDTCDALGGQPADLLVWSVDSQGELEGPVLLPWPAVEDSDSAPGPIRRSGCTTVVPPEGLGTLALLLLGLRWCRSCRCSTGSARPGPAARGRATSRCRR